MTTELALVVRHPEVRTRLWLEDTTSGVHLGRAHELPRVTVEAADAALASELGVSSVTVAAARKLASMGVSWFEGDAPEPDARRRAAESAPAFAAYVRGHALRPREVQLVGTVDARGDLATGRVDVLELALDAVVPDAAYVDLRTIADGWARGTDLPSPALALALRVLAADALHERGLVTSSWEVAPFVHMLPVRTPTLPPATHTNAFLVGDRSMILVEPATPFEDEIERIVAMVERFRAHGRVLEGIVLTHHHPDHVGGATALRERLGAPLLAHARTADRLRGEVAIDRELVDGDRIVLEGGVRLELDVIHTPGHAPGHLCLRERSSGALIAGDMVAGVGTILVEPNDGDMRLYLESLARMRALGATMILPAHGGVIRDPAAWLDFYVAHRLAREAKILAALAELGRPATLAEVVPIAYADTSPMAWPLARMSSAAHLDKLAHEGRVRRADDRWELVRGGASSVN